VRMVQPVCHSFRIMTARTSSAVTQALAENEQRRCPICQSRSSEVLFQQSFRGLDRIGLLDGYDVVACQSCGMTYADHIPPQSAFDEYYRELSKYAYEHRTGKESPDDEWRLRQVADMLHSFIPNRESRILEIGCANGRLLSFLKGDGYSNIFGLDPSPDCAHSARNHYRIEVFTGSLFDAPVDDHSYDFLILLGVLEHVRDLGLAATTLRSFLTDNGLVYLEVPDPTNFVAERDAPFQEFSTEHLNFFSPTALRYLMEGAGFKTVEATSLVRPDRAGKPCPLVYGVFQNSDVQRTEFPRHFEAEAGLRRYVAQCGEMDTALRRRIDQSVRSDLKLFVWGVGTHTQRLLATGALNPVNIVAFVDSNTKYQDQYLHGIPVLAPDKLQGRPEPILISSYGFQQEIADQIRGMKLANELILLYPSSTTSGEQLSGK
jgi:SAM-dependent methyltransferase